MSTRRTGLKYIFLLLIMLIPLSLMVGLSLWIVTENIEVKPELGIEDVIIKYLDKDETVYDGNIQLPSNTYLGLTDELTYFYKGSNDEEYIPVDLTNLKGPINVDDYLIKVLYYEEVITSNNEIIKIEKEIKDLSFNITQGTINMSGVTLNNASKVYNTEHQSISISGTLPKEITGVTYSGGGTNVGTYTVTASFEYDTKNYKNVESKSATLIITQKDLSELNYNFGENETGVFNYTGSDIEEIINDFNITYGTKTLENTTDYTIDFENIKDIGNYNINATGVGNYKGSLNVSYTILSSTINIIFDTTKTYEYTGEPVDIEIAITVKNSENELVVPENISYQYKQQNGTEYIEGLPIDSTAYKILITVEHSSYASVQKEVEIIINKAPISKATISLVKDAYDYNGSAQNAQISTVLFNGKELVLGDDYFNPKCENNTNAGDATITITGTGNFTGTLSKPYKINKIDPTITFPTITSFAEGGKPVITKEGSVTGIDGSAVNGQLVMDSTSSIKFPDGEASSVTVEISYSFVSENSNYNNVSRKKTTATLLAVAYIGSTYYGTINRAVEAANNGNSKNVYVIHNLGISIPVIESFTINSGVNVYVTYDGTNHKVGASGISSLSATTYADANATAVSTNRKTLINLVNGADIIIASNGSLYLGGQTRRIGVTGLYTEINLDTGSGIEVSGRFECYGYVKEINAKNGNQDDHKQKYNNDYDQDRLINVKSGGQFYTTACFYDVADVMTMKNSNDNNIFPLSVFDFSSVQTYLQIEEGAQFKATTFIYQLKTDEEIIVNEEIDIISNEGAAMFKLISGNLGIEYCPTSETFTKRSDITRFYLNGTLSIGYISFTMKIKGIPATISTENVFLPISYKFNLFINDSGNFTAGYKMKFLPGSLLQINGGSFAVNSEVIFYTAEHSSYVDRYPTTYGDAKLINNGNLSIESAGKLGAFIDTQAEDNSATIDLTNATNSTQLTVTTIDGEGKNTISITSSGYFVDTSENGKSIYQFVAGSIVNSANDNKQCWDGTKYELMKLHIVIAPTDYKYNIYAYEVYVSSNQSGSDKTLVSFDNNGYAEVPLGKFVNIIVTRSKSSTLNGVTINSNEWYEITSNMEILITPNKGRKVHVYTQVDSGNSDTTFTVIEKDPNGNETELYNATGSLDNKGVDLYVVDGWQVKATCSMGLAGSVGAKTEPDQDNFKVTMYDDSGNVISEDKYTQKFITVNNDCSIYFPRKAKGSGSSCIAAGTLITLWDGSKKPVEEINKDDLLLVFNHETGQYEFANIIFIDDDGWNTYRVINLVFSNGQTTKVIYEHGFYDLDLDEYVYIREDNYKDYIGHSFHTGELINGVYIGSEIILEDVYITEEYTGCYSPVTIYHMNYYTDSLLSMPGGITGLFNIFEMNDDLTINLEKMQEDIEKYGLYTYEDFKDYIPYEVYAAFPAEYFKVSVGKGYITWDGILALIDRYLSLMV